MVRALPLGSLPCRNRHAVPLAIQTGTAPWRNWRSAAQAPIYPVLLVAAYTVGEFGITHAHPAVLVRPLAIGTAMTAVLVVVVGLLAGSWRRGALVVGASVLALEGYWPMILLAAWWVAARRIAPRLRLWRVPSLERSTGALNAFAGAWLIIALVLAVPQILRAPTSLNAPFQLDGSRPGERPDIYVLLLDGYARGDTLAEMGLDNDPFLSALDDRGFDVYDEATGSYEFTVQVLASMMQGRHLTDLPLPNTSMTEVDQHRYLLSLITDAPVLDEFRRIGYEIIVSQSHASHATVWTADRLLSTGTPTDFEMRLLMDTELDRAVTALAPTLMWDAYRERVRIQFGQLRQLGDENVDWPRLSFIHVISPHPPFTFNADGSDAPPIACFPLDCEGGWIPSDEMKDEDYVGRYLAQVQQVNRLTLDALNAVLNDPTAIVVIMSDHGARVDQADHSEWYRTLFAARTPGHPHAFRDAAYATALFPAIAREYFGAEVDLPPATRFAMVDGNRLDLAPVREGTLSNTEHGEGK